MAHSAPEKDDECSSMSSIEMAKMARQEQGNYEMEVCFGDGEADLHVHFNSCPKNPGHPNFIPVKKFSLEHLDPSWRHKYIFDTVQILSDWTVRLVVRGASSARPSHFPFSGRQFRNAKRYGTGFTVFEEDTSNIKASPCSMPNCSISGAHDEYGPIGVETAAHVVFDESEAKNTTVEFFFDENDKNGVMTARIGNFTYVNTELDRSHFDCFTHDMELIDKMNDSRKRAKRVITGWGMLPVNTLPSGLTNMAAIASHPHGLSKHITLGILHLDHSNAQYDTCTCPGSSGAAVLNFIDGEASCSLRDLRFAAFHHIHSGKGDKGLNKAAGNGKPSVFF